ncbi:MAG: hypothetical protein HKN76_21765 [Saprospiraceae bacterium]|nr:hypothetical protein [Saprospiraceae bacterium]
MNKGPDYYDPPALATHPNGDQFAGSETCRECHGEIYESHLETAHYNTSAMASSRNIKGDFREGSNRVELPEVDFVMQKKGSTVYQHTQNKEGIDQKEPDKVDIVIGSGVKGQSFLTWDNDRLFQLQVSYFPPTQTWINSPGYPPEILQRPILDGCLKCHVTFAKNKDFSGAGNRYEANQVLFGVDCERCHRPAAKHVSYHRKHPEIKSAMFMLKLDTLPRQQRLDVCAQCHSGPRDRLLQGNSFSFLSGETLDDYARNFYTGQPDAELDVHGNQYGLLASSLCFIKSENMDCSTCHSPHKNQRDKTDYFNQQCLSCHNSGTTSRGFREHITASITSNCIECHMPNIASKVMSVQLAGDSVATAVYVRTHLIGIYR